MVIDLTKCIGCYNCQIACKDEFVDNDWPPYAVSQPDSGQFWMHVTEKLRGNSPMIKMSYIPVLCQMCNNAPCMTASTGGGLYRRADGIIIADPDLSEGQSQLPAACPYGALFYNSSTNIAQKCIFCAHLLDDSTWTYGPRCVEACPTQCMTFGDLSDSTSAVAQLVAAGNTQTFHPEYGTKPNVFYIGLPMTFLAGAVLANGGDYIQGATVTVTDTSGHTFSTTTNGFGDFEFDQLTAGTTYTLNVTASGMVSATQTIVLSQDMHIGDVVLNPT